MDGESELSLTQEAVKVHILKAIAKNLGYLLHSPQQHLKPLNVPCLCFLTSASDIVSL